VVSGGQVPMILFLLTKPIGGRASEGGRERKAAYRATRRLTVLLWPGSVFVLGGHDDRRFLHSARFVRASDVEQYGVPPEAIFEGGMRWALVLRWGRHKDLFYLNPQREWALAPADDGCEWERLCANVERHLAAWHRQTSLLDFEVEEADDEPTDEERAAAAHMAREAKRMEGRARIRGWLGLS